MERFLYDCGVGEDETRAVPPVRDRFGYLLKHARERMASLSADALRGFDVSGRELAVLTMLADGAPPSQLEAAQRLGIDRTTMVGLVDALEQKGLVTRTSDEMDRRRNKIGRASCRERV